MKKKCSRSAESIEVLALLSNNLPNKRCSWLSRSRDVVETVGGKVVGLIHEEFSLAKSSPP